MGIFEQVCVMQPASPYRHGPQTEEKPQAAGYSNHTALLHLED